MQVQSEVRTNVRLPGDLAARVKEAAKKQHRSMNGQVIELLDRALKQEEGGKA